MSDRRFRQIERQWLASGDSDAFNALIAEGIRSGRRDRVEQIIAGLFTSYDIPFKTDPPHCRTSPVVFQVPMLVKRRRRTVALFSLADNGELENQASRYNLRNIPTNPFAINLQPHQLLRLFPDRLAYDMATLVGVISEAILEQNSNPEEYFRNIVITQNDRQCGRFMVFDDEYSINPQCHLWRIQMRRGIDQIDLILTLTRSPFGDNLELSVENNLTYWGSSSGRGEVQGLRISGERYQLWGFGFDGDVGEDEYQDYEDVF